MKERRGRRVEGQIHTISGDETTAHLLNRSGIFANEERGEARHWRGVTYQNGSTCLLNYISGMKQSMDAGEK